MGYYGKLEEQLQARKLRSEGLSYKEILKYLHVSKSSLSEWCRDIILSPEQLERLRNLKLKGAERGRIIGAKVQQQRRINEINYLLEKGRNDVGNLVKRDRFLIGIALYCAEGDKGDGKPGVANSDPKVIKFMINWFREFCKVSEEKFRGSIWIHDNLDPIKAKEFWSMLTGIPEHQFHKTYIVKNKINSRKIRKNKHNYGVFSIRFADTKTHRKIMGWVSGILDNQML